MSVPRPRRETEAARADPRRAGHVGLVAQIACLLEASAPKPGNVHPGAAFADARYEDFLLSAAAIGPAMAAAGGESVGATIRRAVADSRRVTGTNTNLGIVLLLAPLAKAAAAPDAHSTGDSARDPEVGDARRAALRDRVRGVLAELSVADARDAYAVIRDAAPGGVGSAAEEDVRDEPTVTLLDAMARAADRDSIAREYATGYAITFEHTVPALGRSRAAGLAWPGAIVQAHLEVLAHVPDTLIARKLGREVAEGVSREARRVVQAGGVRTPEGRRAIEAFDRRLRDDRNQRNPGTTADLIAAGLFVLGWSERLWG